MGINENVALDYSLYFDDVPYFVDTSSLHMPLPTSMTACMHIEDDDGSVFIVPSSKSNQSPITFGKVHSQIFYTCKFRREFGAPAILLLCTVSAPHDERDGI